MRAGLCESCRSRPAEFTVSRVVGGHTRRESRLCASCAADRERVRFGDKGLLLTDLLQSMMATDSVAGFEADRTKVCPGCGNTLDEARKSGVLGCSMCYVVFKDDVDALLAAL